MKSEFHQKKSRHHEHLEGKKSAATAKVGLVSEKSILELKVDSIAQTSLGACFGSKRKSQYLYGDSDASGVFNKSTIDMTATTSADICKANVTNTSTKKVHKKTCFGIIRIHSTEHKKAIVLYTQYASISSKAKYRFLFYGERPQLFANNFTDTGCI